MSRKSEYITLFNSKDIAKKIKSVKAMDARDMVASVYKNVSVNIDSIADILEEVFPNKWDIVLRRKREHTEELGFYNSSNRPFIPEFIIHFPQIIITNSKGAIHCITDLYIKLEPKSTDGSFSFKNFSGKRMSASKEEINNKYQHSHLSSARYLKYGEDSSSSGAFNFRSFCLGTSEINQVLTMLMYDYKPGIFRLFLLQLEEYLNWESLEGTPHITISSIMNAHAPESLSFSDIARYYNSLKGRKENQKEIDFTLEGNQVRILDNEKYEEFLRLWENKYNYDSNTISRKDNAGNYYSYAEVSNEIICGNLSNEENLEKVSFMFRQQKVEFKLINANQEIDNTFYIHKQIKEYVTEKIEERIKSKRLRTHITEQLNTINNLPKSTRQNRLFVPSN